MLTTSIRNVTFCLSSLVAMLCPYLSKSSAAQDAASWPFPLPPRQAPHYQVTILPLLEGFTDSRAYGLNARGQVVGQVAILEPKLVTKAVLWDQGAVREISVPDGTECPAALGINDKGQIVGGARIDNYGSHGYDYGYMAEHAYLWDAGLTKDLEGAKSHASAINDDGSILESMDNGGFVRTAKGKLDLPRPNDALYEIPSALNDGGDAIGVIMTDEKAGYHRQGVLWSKGHVLVLGSQPDQEETDACAINDRGQVVGSYGKNHSYNDLPFLWSAGRMVILPPLDGGTNYNQALGINNSCEIVGDGLRNGEMHAVLWLDGIPHDLNHLIPGDSGLTLMKGYAINDAGQIAGEGIDKNFNVRAVLLTPEDPGPSGTPTTPAKP